MDERNGVAIQGEPGSNSHRAAQELFGPEVPLLPCRLSADVVRALERGEAAAAVLPIENSLHGSVAEHYDLLLESPLRIDAEVSLRIEHHLIAAPGVSLGEIRTILSHPVAISQCRTFLSGFPQAQATPFYDTAGSVRHLMTAGLRDVAGLAPRLAAEMYGAEILRPHVEDHRENFTRFYLLHPQERAGQGMESRGVPNKMTAAFLIEHRPGTLVAVLQEVAGAGGNLTRIESRPVAGRPWEYSFFVELRFTGGHKGADQALDALRRHAGTVRELGRYVAA